MSWDSISYIFSHCLCLFVFLSWKMPKFSFYVFLFILTIGFVIFSTAHTQASTSYQNVIFDFYSRAFLPLFAQSSNIINDLQTAKLTHQIFKSLELFSQPFSYDPINAITEIPQNCSNSD